MKTNSIKKVSVASLSSPEKKDLVQIFKDHWWVIEDENVLFVRGYSPQCNPNQKIVESIRDRIYPDLEVRLIPLMFVPIRSNYFDFDV